MVYPQHVVDAVQQLIANTSQAPMTRLGGILDLFVKENISYTSELCPDVLLVHPENRSKLGVNPFNVHRTGAYIKKAGADFKELSNAVAFELSPNTADRDQQISFNKKLVEHSGGMMAPVNGSERFLTVSCGHTSQFCKAARVHCTTPQLTLQDADGKLSIDHVAKDDPKFKVMLTIGWTWTIIPWQAAEQWPELPDLAQRALNASNSVASKASELEVASSIAEFAQLQAKTGPIDWKQCAEAAGSTAPSCKTYIATISDYVRKFGGGEGAPMVQYLDFFAKKYGEHKLIGEEFWRAVTDTVLHPSPVQQCPHLRTGFIATNLVAPKVVDGIARLLVKTDIATLGKKDKRATVEEAESMLTHGWDAAMKHVSKQHVQLHDVYPLLGKLHARTVLHITGKAKSGFEQRGFKSMQEIQGLFAEDFGKILPAGVQSEVSWVPSQTVQQTSSQPKSGLDDGFCAMEDLANPAKVCERAGYVVGSTYVHKQSKLLFKLVSVGGQCSFTELNLGFSKPAHLEVSMLEVCSGKVFSKFQGTMPEKLSDSLAESKHINGLDKLQSDILRCKAFEALVGKAGASDEQQAPLVYCLHPPQLRAKGDIGKHKLELVPVTMFANILVKKPACTCFEAAVGKQKVWLTEPPRPKDSDNITWRPDVSLAPFWWVGTTSQESAANMVLKRASSQDISFMMYTNTRAIKQHEVLCVYAPPSTSEQHTTATIEASASSAVLEGTAAKSAAKRKAAAKPEASKRSRSG